MNDSKKKILLIEDDEDLRELYRTTIGGSGYLLDEAVDGREGISKITSAEKYDLILLDIMLPKFDGLEVLRTMKRSRDLADVPVLMLTNLGQDSIIKEAFSLGADGYLIKSEYNPEQLLREISNFLEDKK